MRYHAERVFVMTIFYVVVVDDDGPGGGHEEDAEVGDQLGADSVATSSSTAPVGELDGVSGQAGGHVPVDCRRGVRHTGNSGETDDRARGWTGGSWRCRTLSLCRVSDRGAVATAARARVCIYIYIEHVWPLAH